MKEVSLVIWGLGCEYQRYTKFIKLLFSYDQCSILFGSIHYTSLYIYYDDDDGGCFQIACRLTSIDSVDETVVATLRQCAYLLISYQKVCWDERLRRTGGGGGG